MQICHREAFPTQPLAAIFFSPEAKLQEICAPSLRVEEMAKKKTSVTYKAVVIQTQI